MLRSIQIEQGFGEAHYALAWAFYDMNEPQKGYAHVKRVMETGAPLESIRDLVEKFIQKGRPKNLKDTRKPPPAVASLKVDEKREIEYFRMLYNRGVLALKKGKVNEEINILE